MTELTELRRAVVASPDDDTPRLVYADACQEVGTPEALAHDRFIRLQIEIEKYGPRSVGSFDAEDVYEDDLGPGYWRADAGPEVARVGDRVDVVKRLVSAPGKPPRERTVHHRLLVVRKDRDAFFPDSMSVYTVKRDHLSVPYPERDVAPLRTEAAELFGRHAGTWKRFPADGPFLIGTYPTVRVPVGCRESRETSWVGYAELQYRCGFPSIFLGSIYAFREAYRLGLFDFEPIRTVELTALPRLVNVPGTPDDVDLANPRGPFRGPPGEPRETTVKRVLNQLYPRVAPHRFVLPADPGW